MKNLFRFFCLASLVLSFSLAIPAQDQTGDDTAVKTFEVRLPVTVTDKKKKKDLVAGLKRGDFAVFEDGVQQEVTFFTDKETNPPVYVGVLMDTSPSTAGKM